jgi:hypothetical protein
VNNVSDTARDDDFSLAGTNELEDRLSDDLRARVKRELEPGERLVWAAWSNPPVEPHGVGFYVVRMITLGFLVLGLYLIVPRRHVRHWDDGSGKVVGIGALLISGLAIMSMTANWNNRRKERRRQMGTCYAVTDRRAIVWAPELDGRAIRAQAMRRPLVKNLVRIERPDGSGHLGFSDEPVALAFGYYHQFAFAHIPDVRRVEQIVRNNLITSEPIA